jgi:hypothetical protein
MDEDAYRSEGLVRLKDAKRADFTIKCDGFKFEVHKVMVGSCSKFFARCIDGEFKVSQSAVPTVQTANSKKESEASSVTLEEQEPYVVAMALMHIYTGYHDAEDVKAIWPNLGQRSTETEKDNADFLDSRLKLLMLAEFLFLDRLFEDVSDEIFDRIETIECEHKNAFGEWTGSWVDMMSSMTTATTFTLDVLDKIYDHIPHANQLRSRAIPKALTLVKAVQTKYEQRMQYRPYDGNGNGWGPGTNTLNANQQEALDDFNEAVDRYEVQVPDLQKRLTFTIEAQDPVAYKVALHYRDEIDKLKNDPRNRGGPSDWNDLH